MARALVGQLTVTLFVFVGIVVFGLGVLIAVPVLTAIGLTDQQAAGIVGVAVLVGFWVLGLMVLFR